MEDLVVHLVTLFLLVYYWKCFIVDKILNTRWITPLLSWMLNSPWKENGGNTLEVNVLAFIGLKKWLLKRYIVMVKNACWYVWNTTECFCDTDECCLISDRRPPLTSAVPGTFSMTTGPTPVRYVSPAGGQRAVCNKMLTTLHCLMWSWYVCCDL